ncbi:hypothetical protein [Dolosigranulum pigrum]|uniref:hypothetical protein n=1 Tax=Dolosigranulum pigrum TaxID=29394 RepID=UPI000DBFAD3A|nr:hypothetical protein [Dolosigranulum pigrum]RAN64467.1 hypothetical protein B8A45_05540 [Dolosigranulum pigrum]
MIDWLINFVVERPGVIGIALVLILFDVTPISKYTDKFFEDDAWYLEFQKKTEKRLEKDLKEQRELITRLEEKQKQSNKHLNQKN